jgi:hypothetical protein
MEKRYHALRTIANIYRVIGYIILVLTILAVIATCAISVISGAVIESAVNNVGVNTSGTGLGGSLFIGFLTALGIIIYGGILGLSLVAMGEGIYLLISVEENTRRTAIMVESQNKLPPAAPQATA